MGNTDKYTIEHLIVFGNSMGKLTLVKSFSAKSSVAAVLVVLALILPACTMELGITEMASFGPFTAKSSTDGKINETNLTSATFVGYCKVQSQIVISSNLVPNLATFTCAAESPWTQTVDLSALPSTYIGQLTFKATAISGEEQTKIVDINLDNIPPTIALNTQPVVNSVNQAAYPVSGSCSEDGEAVAINISGVTKSTPCSSGAFATTLDLTSLSGTSVVISATHADPAGNSRSATASVVRQTAIPTLTSFTINNDDATTTSASATLNASVTGATQMYISNSAGCTSGGSWVAYAASSAWNLPNSNTTNTVYAKFRDNWGNETVCASDSILLDDAAPTLSITSPLAGAFVTSANVSAFTISGSCSENARSITLTGPNSFTATTTCNGTSFSAILNVGVIAQGDFQLDAAISDAAGNSATATSPLYHKDTVAPTGSISIHGGAATTSNLLTSLTLTYSEAGQMYVTNTAGCSANGTWETSAASKSWTLPTSGASNTVYAKFRDAAGNESPCYSDDITHVITLATVSLASPAAGSYINLGNANAFTVSGACSEAGENVTIAVAGLADSTVACSSGAWTKTLNVSSLTDGSISFTISHSTATSAVQSFTKETVAPVINSFTINSGAAYTSSLSATLDIDVTAATEMYITDSALCLTGGSWETYASSKSRTLATANAINTVYFKARDTYGNESNCVSDSITHDSVIPTVTITGSVAGTWINNTNKSSFPMSGTCSEITKTIVLTVTSTAITKNTTCNATSGGTWSTTVNMSTLADDAVTPYEIVATSTRTSGNSASASASYYKDIVLPAVPTLSNTPAFADAAMNITVVSSGATQYQYFVILPGDIVTTCTSGSTFSGSKISIATPITDTMTSTGTYKVCTKAWDDATNSATVSSATSFVHDSQGPQLLSVTSSAADGVYDVGATIPIKVTFDENVTVTGTPQLTLETGTTDRVINYTSGTGTPTLTFNYVVQSGDESTDLDYVSTSSLSLNGGTLKDSYGQDANITLPTPGSTLSLGGQKSIALSVTTGLTPVVTGYLTGINSETYFAATVSGSNITHYKYAVITSGTCATATYGFAQPKASLLTYSPGADGPYNLCVIGGSSSTTFQPATDALSFPWVKESLSLVGITSPAQNRVIEGGADQTITVTMSSAKNYDIDVYYKVSGDAVNPTNHNIASGTITFPAGSTTQNITVSFPDNAVVEGEKLLTFYITGSNSNVMSVAEKYIAQYFIKDNDSSLTITDFKMSTMTACSITSDNTLRCLGHNGRGTLGNGNTVFQSFANVVTPGTGYASVSVGREMTCAITTLGALYCWGDIEGVATTVTTPMLIDAANSYLSVAVGNRHACGITTANKLRCWGRNVSYQLGDGTNVSKAAVSIDATEDYKFITAGAFNTCGITSNDVLKCWGESTNYAGGTGTLIQTPTIIDSGVAYKAASIGTSHACGITTAGTMKCWGANVSSQLGDGTTTTSMTPVVVDSTPAYTKVSVSQTLNTIKNNDFTCALTVAGTVKCWGYNNNQQLGDGSYTLRSTPVLSDSGALYTSIEVSGHRSCGITSDGALKCWGAMETNANFYHYGMQGQYYLARFTTVQPEFNFTQYSGFNYFGGEIGNRICGIASNKLYCWGSNDTTNSFSGDRTSTANRRTAPILIDANTNYASITDNHQQDTCAITTDGYIKCWGYNRYGEFGTGIGVGYFAKRPVIIDNFNRYSKVASQYETICGITQTGVLKCSGGNDSYQLGDGTTTHATTMTTVDPGVTYKDVALGQSHVCGITTSDVLKCWGGNSQGQVGVGNTSNVTTPTVVDSGVSYKKVISGASWNCAITTANKLKCWGANGVNQLGTGDTSNKLIPTVIDSARDYMDVSTSWSSSCALETSGNMRCWGSASGHIGLATGSYESGITNAVTTPQPADPGVTYNKVFVRQGAVCGITTGGDTRCAGRFIGANLGTPDSGVIGISSADTQAGVIHMPTYMQKWFGL
ncbi:hypothetical protein ACLVWU_04930 [Bdellovibrio sp. HCB290]|uniref:hypothetical protein n=1 Tax=Bdellovibrio sp. HCB290 TaxID=3394356 RepID=UPI0039B4CC02